ncbi:MAG: hypothetical protein DHS20C02_19970 [Micavibrio sp.]|nr:MAG: hypothetical protein DHS20C02_19970 [Micavibrio sp.]
MVKLSPLNGSDSVGPKNVDVKIFNNSAYQYQGSKSVVEDDGSNVAVYLVLGAVAFHELGIL